MKPTFIQPCFIRKNTPELFEKLEELGYRHIQYDWPQKIIDKCRILFTDFYGSYWHHYLESQGKDFINTHLDCGTDEDLFLAIAALREDSDYMQWFTTDDFSEWHLSTHSFSHKRVVSTNRWHKATVEELIENFKKD